MLERLIGADHISAQYAPFARLERVNPLLRRELGLVSQGQVHQTLNNYDDQFLRIVIVIYAISVCACCWASMSNAYIAPIFILTLPSALISIGVDMVASVRMIFRWHAANQREDWDTLRLALHDDEELIATYEAIGNVRSWSVFRLDMTMRALPAGIAAVVGAAVLLGAVVFGLTSITTQPMQVIGLIVIGLFLIRMAILYISDPLWRFRANTLWSLLCAILFRDTATAIAAAVGGSLGVRMLHLGGLVVVSALSNNVLAGQTFFTTRFNYPLFIVWFLVLAAALIPITRWCYRQLYRWLMRRTLFALRSGGV